jgi:membrane protease YdiL (CAAX protease family)
LVPHPAFRRRPFVPGGSYRLVLASFVGAYAIAEVILAPSLVSAGGFYPEGLGLLVLLAAGVLVGGMLESRQDAQRFYLALCIVPSLTIARLALASATPVLLAPLFLYLLLAVTILVLRQTANVGSVARDIRRGDIVRALPLGAVVATGFAILGTFLPGPGSVMDLEGISITLVVLVPVTLLDELWFRGILQRELSGLTSSRWGWLATAALFAAYGAPFGNAIAILFRAGYGLSAGAIVMRPQNVPVALASRMALVVALVLLNPTLVGTSVIV